MISTEKYDFEAQGIDLKNAVEKTNKLTNEVDHFMTFCPNCHSTRKKKKRRELRVDINSGYCTCYHCGNSWRLDTREYLEQKNKARQLAEKPTVYTRPKDTAPTGVYGVKMLTYLTETRCIPLSVLQQLRVGEQEHYIPATQKKENCLVFNYYEQGFLINQKFRDGKKNFALVQGAELIPYNIDSILGQDTVVITEGEFDCLSVITAGYTSVISVPNGASAETNWMDRFYELYFEDKKRVLIATDMDAPGHRMAESLTRRFGPELCYRVNFSWDCKDANEQLCKHGVDSLKKCLDEAKPIPLKDIVSLSQFEQDLDAAYENGFETGQTTGWANLDKQVTFGTGQLAIVTGRTGDGKSEWLDELMIRLMLRTGWHAAYWSPENTLLDHSRKLVEKLTGRMFTRNGNYGVQPDQYALCKQWMQERLTWIDLPFDQLHLSTILERARSAVRKFGIRILVLDPYNFIEKENTSQLSENAWDSRVVGEIRSFAIKHDVLVFLVAHPRKVEMQIDGHKRRITLEDISGTADFGNKTDYCFCVDRNDERKVVTISIDKVRRKQFGRRGGQVHYVYQPHSGRYAPCEIDEARNPMNTDFKTDAGMWLKPKNLFGETVI